MKKLAGFGGGLALAALLAGCVSPGLAARERSLAQRLEDVAPPAARRTRPTTRFAGLATLERAALVREALRRNPGLEAARSAWRAALARYPQEIALEDPMLDTAIGPASFGSDEVDPGLSRGALAGAAVPRQARAARRGGAGRGRSELAGIRGGAPPARGDGVAALRRVLPGSALARAQRAPPGLRRGALEGDALALRVRQRVAAGRAARRGGAGRAAAPERLARDRAAPHRRAHQHAAPPFARVAASAAARDARGSRHACDRHRCADGAGAGRAAGAASGARAGSRPASRRSRSPAASTFPTSRSREPTTASGRRSRSSRCSASR